MFKAKAISRKRCLMCFGHGPGAVPKCLFPPGFDSFSLFDYLTLGLGAAGFGFYPRRFFPALLHLHSSIVIVTYISRFQSGQGVFTAPPCPFFFLPLENEN